MKLLALDFNDNEITDEGVQHISNINSLENLSCSNENITDNCLEFISRLPHLKVLRIHTGHITCKGIMHHLKAVESLKEIFVNSPNRKVKEFAQFCYDRGMILNNLEPSVYEQYCRD